MAISTNGTIYARLAGGLYNTVLSNATYLELVAQDPSTVANKLYAADFGKMTDLQVGTTIVANLGLSALTGLDAWVAAQLTAAGAANKGAKIVSMLNDFSAMTADTTYGTYATAFNTKVDAALAASQTTGKAEAKFSAAAPTVTSFTLTTGVDAIVGSAGDDTITAPATVAATGVAQTTINSGDSIDGGAGTDTLTLTLAAANNSSLSGLTITNVEKISYVGSDNLGSGAAATATAVTAKATADTALVVAAGAATLAAQLKAAAAEVAAFNNVTTTIEEKIAAAKIATVTIGGATTYTVAQLNAAATAAQSSAAGTTLITTADDSTAMNSRAGEINTGLGTALTAANTALTTAQAAAATAAINATAALGAQGAASITAPTGSTSITIDGAATTVTGLGDTQTVTGSSSAAANTLKYSSTATTANLGLTSGGGTYTIADASTTTVTSGLVTANVSGSTKQTAATLSANAKGGKITIDETSNGGTDTIKTVNVAMTNDSEVVISGLTKVTKIDGAASTGGLTLAPLSTTLSVTTGAGKDVVTFIPLTDVTTASKATSSLSTGAGNDTITVTVDTTSTGTTTVDAGDGDDSVTLAVLGTATVDGGAGKDTINLSNATFSTGSYNALKALANFEVLGLTAAAGAVVDASKAAQFTEFTFKQAADADAAITKVADAQIINSTKADVSVSASGYVAKGTANADGDTATSTAYAGALTVNAKGGGQTGVTGADDANTLNLTVNATSLTLNVTTVASSTTPAVTGSFVTLTGDVKTATINVSNGVDKTSAAGTDVSSTVKIAASDAATGGAFTNLGNLTAVTLTGTGAAIVDNSDNNDTTATLPGTKLASIDASGLVGKKTIAGSTLGDPTAGLTWTAGKLVETVKLGSAQDKLTVATANSTYAKMDSITGFSLIGDATGVLTATTALKSDDIAVGAITSFAKAATGYSATSLDAALATLGARAADNVVFQVAGNTYIFVDSSASTSTTIEDADTLIELVGLVDLDNLVLALNGLN